MNRNKKIAIVSLLAVVALGAVGFTVYNKGSHLSQDTRVLERVDYVSKNETTIDENTKITGTHIRNGGPYKVGETVLTYGMAIKIEKVGVREGLESSMSSSSSGETPAPSTETENQVTGAVSTENKSSTVGSTEAVSAESQATETVTSEDQATTAVSEETVPSEDQATENISDHTKFAVFKLDVYNLNSLPYDLKTSDVTLIYDEKKSGRIEQPVTTEGYNNWKFIKGSYEFEPVGTSTYRSGYIYFPVTDEVKKGGFVRIMLQNIPIDFNF